jgi:hypothetical protein
MLYRLIPDASGGLTRKQLFWIVVGFWAYVTLSNILYAEAMSAAFSWQVKERLFSPWTVRLVQHAVLLPAVLLCYLAALRID